MNRVVLGLLLGAATIVPGLNGQVIPEADSRPLYSPRSGLSKATIGTLDSDIDRFMSVQYYRDMKNMNTWFAFVGSDEQGFNLGYARNLGSLYLGISYGGSLIDDLFSRITNRDPANITKNDTMNTDANDVTSTDHRIMDAATGSLSGTAYSKNDIGILFGFGNIGIKLGFTEYLEGTYNPTFITIRGPENSTRTMLVDSKFENSIKPSVQFGGKFKNSSITFRPMLWAAFDIHQLSQSSNENVFVTWFETTDEDGQAIDSRTDITNSTWEYLGDYVEPSGGISLGFDFSKSDRMRSEFSLGYNAAYRMYNNNDAAITDLSELVFTTVPPDNGIIKNDRTITELFDLRNHIAAAFLFSSELNTRLSIGVKGGVDIDYNIMNKTDTTTGGAETAVGESTITTFAINPELDVGVSFRFIPEHFAMHAGLGILLYAYDETTTLLTVGDDTTKQVERNLSMPTLRFGTGLTFNFNVNTAVDVLLISSGLDMDATKFTLLFSMKY
ncbi:MAG: hypothetical protein LBT13_06475 [Treponema sp.]|nr:hypothetical protein [Treponema sp.]